MVYASPAGPTRHLPHAGELSSSQADEVLPFLRLSQATWATSVLESPEMPDTLISLPDPSG